MDLLGDLGASDQLTSARAENAILLAKVKELTVKVQDLSMENQALLVEVEMYRKEAALPSFSNLALGKAPSNDGMDVDDDLPDEFVRSGNGIFPSDPAVTLEYLHGNSNPLCCALNSDDTVLATGGADSHLVLCAWGSALAPVADAALGVVQKAIRIRCDAPVIATAISGNLVAAGSMDGSVTLVEFHRDPFGSLVAQRLQFPASASLRHVKYVKALKWCPTTANSTCPLLATASADGTVKLTKVKEDGSSLETIQTLHLTGPVESMAFTNDGRSLCCYARGTPYLSYFDLEKNCAHTKVNLNTTGANGGFEDHISFAVMDMAMSPGSGKYLALATDTSRNIIMDATSGKQYRNLYGHTNDGFSQPKIAWSSNGQYIFGNTQEDASVCVWDIASSSIVKRLDQTCGGHAQPVRDLFSSGISDTLVTTSFDKNTKIWLTPST